MKKVISEHLDSGKKVYLLGADQEGTKYWLEEPSWDCDWYWGLGYVETYTSNDSPRSSRDINSHQHFDGLILNGPSYGFENFKNFFKETPLTDDEIWELIDLMKTCYTLRTTAELFHSGHSHQTERAKIDILKDKTLEDKINKELLPAVFKRIQSLFEGK